MSLLPEHSIATTGGAEGARNPQAPIKLYQCMSPSFRDVLVHIPPIIFVCTLANIIYQVAALIGQLVM